jgi:hypothetical protein
MNTNDDLEIKEYSAAELGKGVRGKHFNRYTQSSNVVVLDDAVAKAFPNAAAVNQALMGLLTLAKKSTHSATKKHTLIR